MAGRNPGKAEAARRKIQAEADRKAHNSVPSTTPTPSSGGRKPNDKLSPIERPVVLPSHPEMSVPLPTEPEGRISRWLTSTSSSTANEQFGFPRIEGCFVILLFLVQLAFPFSGIQQNFWLGLVCWTLITGLIIHILWVWKATSGLTNLLRLVASLAIVGGIVVFTGPRLKEIYSHEHPAAPFFHEKITKKQDTPLGTELSSMVTVHLGGMNSVDQLIKGPRSPFGFGGEEPITMHMKGGKLLVDVNVGGMFGLPIISVHDNEFTKPPVGWDRNFHCCPAKFSFPPATRSESSS
jgi:hypothetical protein